MPREIRELKKHIISEKENYPSTNDDLISFIIYILYYDNIKKYTDKILFVAEEVTSKKNLDNFQMQEHFEKHPDILQLKKLYVPFIKYLERHTGISAIEKQRIDSRFILYVSFTEEYNLKYMREYEKILDECVTRVNWLYVFARLLIQDRVLSVFSHIYKTKMLIETYYKYINIFKDANPSFSTFFKEISLEDLVQFRGINKFFDFIIKNEKCIRTMLKLSKAKGFGNFTTFQDVKYENCVEKGKVFENFKTMIKDFTENANFVKMYAQRDKMKLFKSVFRTIISVYNRNKYNPFVCDKIMRERSLRNSFKRYDGAYGVFHNLYKSKDDIVAHLNKLCLLIGKFGTIYKFFYAEDAIEGKGTYSKIKKIFNEESYFIVSQTGVEIMNWNIWSSTISGAILKITYGFSILKYIHDKGMLEESALRDIFGCDDN